MSYDCQVDVVGMEILVACTDDEGPLNWSTLASAEIWLRGPRGPRVKKTAAVYGDDADGVLSCTTEDGDITHPGTWQMQAHVTFDDDTYFASEPATFEVGPNL